MQSLELDDIQGIIVRGYGTHRFAAFELLEIRDRAAARRWLGELSASIMDGVARPQGACVNIAFTRHGLEALGLDEGAVDSFGLEFRDGMSATEHRRRILGDVGADAPEHWRWGGPDRPVHVLLMLYAPSQESLREHRAEQRRRFELGGLQGLEHLDTLFLPGRKEHFGFRDGIGQPLIAGYKEGSPGNSIEAGEFLFGYLDEYGALPLSPAVEAAQDPQGLLAQHPGDPAKRDLGRNGSYLVFRQLEQNVATFWSFVARGSERVQGSTAQASERVALAAKMVGRWPSGAPLLLSPDGDDPALADEDTFTYHAKDPNGDRCPLGSHVRRTNPRDSLEPKPGSEESLKVGKRHRIIRRGRAYGEPLASSMAPEDLAATPDDGAERGLHFICFNTNLNRQFEFIQHTWVNNTKFGGLYDDADPLIGEHDPEGTGKTGTFTVPGEPVRQRVTGLERFVHLRGGAYFFMPGKRALRYLASLG